MAKNDFVKPTTKNSPAIHTGANRDNGPASMYTGFKYPEGGGNDIGIYKQPMENPNNGLAKAVTERDFTNKKSAYDVGVADPAMTVSVGYDDKINARGTMKMRGYGAAIKGHKISGKQG
jgi:hypothetical protein